jgi:hypothetical protein
MDVQGYAGRAISMRLLNSVETDGCPRLWLTAMASQNPVNCVDHMGVLNSVTISVQNSGFESGGKVVGVHGP